MNKIQKHILSITESSFFFYSLKAISLELSLSLFKMEKKKPTTTTTTLCAKNQLLKLMHAVFLDKLFFFFFFLIFLKIWPYMPLGLTLKHCIIMVFRSSQGFFFTMPLIGINICILFITPLKNKLSRQSKTDKQTNIHTIKLLVFDHKWVYVYMGGGFGMLALCGRTW